MIPAFYMSSTESTRGKSLHDLVSSLDWSTSGIKPLDSRVRQDREQLLLGEITAEESGQPLDLILKQYREYPLQPRPPRMSARIEAEMLRRLAPLAAIPAGDVVCTVPRVALYDEPRAIVVTVKAKGRPLDEIVVDARNRLKTANAKNAVRAAGTWLRSMQSIAPSDTDPATLLEKMIARADADLQEVTRRDPLVSRHRPLIESALRSSTPLRAVVVHGDFWPGNVFVSERSVSVIDFEGSSEGLPFEDAAYFLIHLEMYFRLPLLSWQFRRLADAFFAGYGTPDDPSSWRAAFTAKALQVMARGGAAATGSRLLRRAVRNALLRNLNA